MTHKRILIVDDEHHIIEMLREVLNGEGYDVESAADAGGALDLIRDKIFDAAVLDFNLPDMDGVMLHRQIRQMDPELAQRTVFVSGYQQGESNLGYYTAQGGRFLAKPFDARDVVSAIRSLLASDQD